MVVYPNTDSHSTASYLISFIYLPCFPQFQPPLISRNQFLCIQHVPTKGYLSGYYDIFPLRPFYNFMMRKKSRLVIYWSSPCRFDPVLIVCFMSSLFLQANSSWTIFMHSFFRSSVWPLATNSPRSKVGSKRLLILFTILKPLPKRTISPLSLGMNLAI